MIEESRSLAETEKLISSKIFLIRSQNVMLDRDLASLYGVETKRLKEQVKRNMNRFPEHFMFQLSKTENEDLRSQNATLKRGGFSKYLPMAFTEHGVLMLASVLKSDRAIQMSIKIIDVFVRMRKLVLEHRDILLKLEQLEKKVDVHDADIQIILECVRQLIHAPNPPRERIGFRRSNEKEKG